MARKRLVIGNWKQYIETAEAAGDFARALKRKTRGLSGVDVAVAVPAPFIAGISKVFESSPVRVGAQSVSGVGSFDSAQDKAHTGEMSAAMARSAGASFALIGHSERRALGDTNEVVHQQFVAAAQAGLVPVLCVGEREHTDDGAHFSVVAEQLVSALRGAQSLASKLVVAYEPVWAIGKHADAAPSPASVREMIIFIRKTLADVLTRQAALRAPVLYGGAVEPENAPALIAESGVSGLLVGHASVSLDKFIAILNASRPHGHAD
jgi:triosephosphate isomerase